MNGNDYKEHEINLNPQDRNNPDRYVVGTHYNMDRRPCAVVVKPLDKPEVSDRVLTQVTGGTAQSHGMGKGVIYAYAGNQDGSKFTQQPYEIRTEHRDARAIPYLKGNSAGHERKESMPKTEMDGVINNLKVSTSERAWSEATINRNKP